MRTSWMVGCGILAAALAVMSSPLNAESQAEAWRASAAMFDAASAGKAEVAPPKSKGLFKPLVIGGSPVSTGKLPAVVRLFSDAGACTGTIVGPRVVLTAGHCGKSGKSVRFRANGEVHEAYFVPSEGWDEYSRTGHDIAVAVTREDIGVRPMSIGSRARVGEKIIVLGYGCTHVGGGGGNDGILRIGETTVQEIDGSDIIARAEDDDEAATCSGDSGGPAFVVRDGEPYLVGINSRANLRDVSIETRADTDESVGFLADISRANDLSICGISQRCS